MAAELAAITTRPWTLMEVCGGQTHAIVRWGLDQLLPPGLRLIHGPGCPVCVTPAATIEQALRLARRPEVILCSYGDMLRVPGEGQESLLAVRACGGDVRLLTTPLQALQLAQSHPERQVVFLAVGFETTAPATALLARQALALGIRNLSLLDAHVRVAPAMQLLLADPANRVQAFLAAGHVCSVLGTGELEDLVARWRVPVVVSGFAPLELMTAVLACVRQLEAGEARVENAYGAVVRSAGNRQARQLLAEVFTPCERPWRGLGRIPGGGLALRGPYLALAARQRFDLEDDANSGDGGETCPSCPPPGPSAAGAASDAPSTAVRSGSSRTAAARERASRLPRHPVLAAATATGVGSASAAQAAERNHPAMELAGDQPPAAAHAGATGSLLALAGGTSARDRSRAPSGDSEPEGPGPWEATATPPCIAGAILRGQAAPPDCQAFGTACRPEQPLGAPMVSSEGACAAYYLYRGASAGRGHCNGDGNGDGEPAATASLPG